MRIACLGGGPAGLYFAISLKLRQPQAEVILFERNRADDTFGWGVVLSDETLDNLARNDAVSAATIREHFAYWDDVALVHQGQKVVSTGHGFCGIGRKRLLTILQDRARELGVDLRFSTEVGPASDYMQDYDVVVACDGLNSRTRSAFEGAFQPDIDLRACQFVWLGTRQKFDDAFTFIFEKTEKGWLWAHAYQFDADTATFIVECSQATCDAYGFAEMSQQESIATCEEIFRDHLGGHPLMTNANHIRGSAWIRFPRVLCQRWSHENVVLLGDAAATAHFSIGSGTKLALESAIALAENLTTRPSVAEAFQSYEDQRQLEVLRLQSAARNSVEWFEEVERYLDLDPIQLNYSLLTRSQRISHENLRARDPAWLGQAERWFQEQAGVQVGDSATSRMARRADVRAVPPARHDAEEPRRGVPDGAVQGGRRLPHRLASDPLRRTRQGRRGAGLYRNDLRVGQGRITPGCPGPLCAGARSRLEAARRFRACRDRGEDLLPDRTFGAQGIDSNWVGGNGQDAPVRQLAADLGLCPAMVGGKRYAARDEPGRHGRGHGAVLSAAANGGTRRFRHDRTACRARLSRSRPSSRPCRMSATDAYGGTLENRMRFPLEVFAAMRAVWPGHKPMSVRISATDWSDQGLSPEDSVEIAKMFAAAGADIVDVSAGQTSTDARPVYGRMFQTPFSDRIRNETGIPTMAVGNIFEADHVNSILMAGRADLVCLARPHLSDPYWLLHAATELGDRQESWPLPYQPGRDQAWRLADRDAEVARA